VRCYKWCASRTVLGPVLFIVYINDIRELASNGVSVKVFAGDTKLYSVFNNNMNSARLQIAICNFSMV